MRARKTWALMLAAALAALLGSACATGQAGFRLGREPQGAAQLVSDEVLVRLKGEAGAVSALAGAGVPLVEANRRVLAAVTAMAVDAVVAVPAGGGR